MNLDSFFNNADEKPLDELVTDGGCCGILRTIGCVGDSLSSGEIERVGPGGEKTYPDLYDYSWGQFLARLCGCTVRNFSRGWMSAKEYCESYAEENGFWDNDKACTAYIIALGVNDVLALPPGGDLGTAEDINLNDYRENKRTFVGYYGEIVQRLKITRPEAKFFFMTMPRSYESGERARHYNRHAELMHEIAQLFDNAYVLDFRAYAPEYDDEFREKFFLGGHMNPNGYLLTARMTASYIDYIIRHNMKDFKNVAFIDLP